MSYVSRYLEPALVERLNHLQLSARRVVEGTTTGLHKSPLKGASIEFRQHRFYVAGDDPRRLDWRVLGRTDRPYIKEYDQETNLRCLLLLDASGSMGYAGGGSGESKFDYACRLAASMAYLMLANTESVGLGLFGAGISRWVAPHAGTGQLSRIIETLERATPRGASAPEKAMNAAADRLGRRSLVILISDCFAPVKTFSTGLARLSHDRHEVMVLRVLDPDETSFPFKTWTQFRGIEGESPQSVDPALMRRTYLDNFGNHRRDLEEGCRRLGAQFAHFPTDVPLLDSLTAFLRRRERSTGR
jgi:uncharacterized protein (DUF58 family)